MLRALTRHPALRQLIRFAVAGLALTLFSSAIYAIAVTAVGAAPLNANLFSHGCGLLAGFVLHSRWSFSGARGDAQAAMFFRFLVGSGAALAMNSLWVWIATRMLHLPPLAPLPMMMTVTPLFSFLLNRHWVFRSRSDPSATLGQG